MYLTHLSDVNVRRLLGVAQLPQMKNHQLILLLV